MKENPITIVLTDPNGKPVIMKLNAQDAQNIVSSLWAVVKDGTSEESVSLSNGGEFYVTDTPDWLSGNLSESFAGRQKE
jgi:hypothetical protein